MLFGDVYWNWRSHQHVHVCASGGFDVIGGLRHARAVLQVEAVTCTRALRLSLHIHLSVCALCSEWKIMNTFELNHIHNRKVRCISLFALLKPICIIHMTRSKPEVTCTRPPKPLKQKNQLCTRNHGKTYWYRFHPLVPKRADSPQDCLISTSRTAQSTSNSTRRTANGLWRATSGITSLLRMSRSSIRNILSSLLRRR